MPPAPAACPAACGRVIPLIGWSEPAQGPAGPVGPARKGELHLLPGTYLGATEDVVGIGWLSPAQEC